MFARTSQILAVLLAVILLVTANSPSSTSVSVHAADEGTPTAPDLSNLNPMTAAGVAMFTTATAMEAGAAALDAESQRRSDSVLADLADHWRADAKDLRDRGIWMMLSQTAGSMVHDPDSAHELDFRSLLANGEVMILEGDSMIAHGKEMSTEVSKLRDSGVLTGSMADQLVDAADMLITTGERIAGDGKEMRDYAERMLDSIGE